MALNMSSTRSSSSLTRTDARNMKVADLRNELTARGLDTIGLKKDLLDRLLDNLSNSPSAAPVSNSSGNNIEKQRRKKSDPQPTKFGDIINPETLYVLRYHGIQHHPSAIASCGLMLYNSETEQKVWSGAQFYSTGESAQEAEMKALSLVIVNLYELGVKRLIIQGHAKGSTVNQLQGHFGVKSKHLQEIYGTIESTMKELDQCEVWGVTTDQVVKTQSLAKKALEKRVSEGFDVFQTVHTDEHGDNENTNADDVHPLDADAGEESIGGDGIDTVQDHFQESLHEHEHEEEEERDNLISLPSFSPDKQYVLRFDGGSRGNPGTSGSGMVLFDSESGLEVWSAFEYLGETTNNVAEYSALLSGLQFASAMGIKQLVAEGDSTLVVKQVTGEYAVKKDHLKPLNHSIKALVKTFDYFSINYIPRAENFRADQLANVAMDEKMSMGLEVLEYMESNDSFAQSRTSQQQYSRQEDIAFDASVPPTQLQSSKVASTFGSGNLSDNGLPIPEADVSDRQLSPHRTYVLRFGGSAKGSSVAGCAAILLDDISGEEIWSGMHYMSDKEGSQFIAGYSGLVIGLRKALSMGAKRLIVESSTEFVINQMAGKWKVKSEVIKPFYLHAKDLCDNYFEEIDFELIPADEGLGDVKALFNEAMKFQKSRLPGFLLS